MYEVYTGSKPGRPALLLALSGLALTTAVGLAWLQIHAKLAPGGPVPLPGTPLIVHPPNGWTAVPDAPGEFVQADGPQRTPHRRIIVRYSRFTQFVPPLAVIENWKWRSDERGEFGPTAQMEKWAVSRAGPATLAGWTAVESRGRRVVKILTSRRTVDYDAREIHVVRVACHPRGDVVTVEYIPSLGMADAGGFELAPGDQSLLDALCDRIEFSDAALRLRGETAMKAAGVDFPVDKSWTLLGPDFLQAPAAWILGTDSQQMPTWSIGLHRTWVSSSRSEADVLADHVAARIGMPIDPARVIESGRLDRMRVFELRVPMGPGMSHPEVAWLLHSQDQDAVLISIECEPRRFSLAQSTAEQLTDTLTFVPLTGWPDMAAAQECGRQCAAKFSLEGGSPWWDRTPARTYLRGEFAGSPAARIDQHQAIDNNARRGFAGASAFRARIGGYYTQARWHVDGTGAGYDLSIKQGRSDESLPPGMTEFRRPDSNVVTRRRGRGDETTFTVGDRFVCPPLEGLAEAWAARNGSGECMIDVSSDEARGVTSRLIRRLPGEKNGPPQVLVIDDYSPRGRIAAYDDQMELQLDRAPGLRLDRVAPGEAASSDLFKELRVLLAD